MTRDAHVRPTASTSPATIGMLVSGGLDSCILLGHLLDQGRAVQPFYVRTGVVWEEAERDALRQYLRAIRRSNLGELVTFDMPLADLYGQHWSVTGDGTPDAQSPDEAVFLPGRNALLLLKPAIWCQLHNIPELTLAPLGTSPFADASLEFFRSFESTLSYLGQPSVRIVHLFASMNKQQVMQWGSSYPLELTFSCISPKGKLHCGTCNKCEERRAAFRSVGRPDLTVYASQG